MNGVTEPQRERLLSEALAVRFGSAYRKEQNVERHDRVEQADRQNGPNRYLAAGRH